MIVLIKSDRRKCFLLENNGSKVSFFKKSLVGSSLISLSVYIFSSVSTFVSAYMSIGVIFILCNAYPINPENKVRAQSCVIITWYHQTVRRSKTTFFFFFYHCLSLFVHIFSTTPFYIHCVRVEKFYNKFRVCVWVENIFFCFITFLAGYFQSAIEFCVVKSTHSVCCLLYYYSIHISNFLKIKF